MSNVYFNGFVLTLGLIMAIGAQNAHVLRQGLRGEHVLLTVSVSALCDMLLITSVSPGWAASSSPTPT
jgi:Lysine efflux permease